MLRTGESEEPARSAGTQLGEGATVSRGVGARGVRMAPQHFRYSKLG